MHSRYSEIGFPDNLTERYTHHGGGLLSSTQFHLNVQLVPTSWASGQVYRLADMLWLDGGCQIPPAGSEPVLQVEQSNPPGPTGQESVDFYLSVVVERRLCREVPVIPSDTVKKER